MCLEVVLFLTGGVRTHLLLSAVDFYSFARVRARVLRQRRSPSVSTFPFFLRTTPSKEDGPFLPVEGNRKQNTMEKVTKRIF